MKINIPSFKGMIPKVPARSLPVEFAQSATNCDLSQGLLKGFYDLSATKTLTGLNCLDYDNKDTDGAFANGASVIGATSGATATVALAFDHGSTGTLVLSGITGTFQNNEIIYVASYGSELLTNGDFESGFTSGLADGWTKYHANQTYTDETTTKHGGSHAQKVTVVDDGNNSGIYQIETNASSDFFILTGWFYSSEDAFVSIYCPGSVGSVYKYQSISASTWTQLTLIYQGNGTNLYNYFFRQCTDTGYGIGDYIIIDDTSLKKITNAALVNGTLYSPDWRSIFPVESGGTTFWLCSQQEAHFVQAPVYGSGERFYFTDGVRPKESNYALASNSGANTYGNPYTSYYMGVPKPSTTLTATVTGSVGTSGDLKLKDVTGTWADNEEIQISSVKYALVNGTISAGNYLGYDGMVATLEFEIGDAVAGGTSSATGTIESIQQTTVDTVSYVYTFITDWGYEGEPSDPCDPVDVGPGQYVRLGNFETTVPLGYNIVGIRIYRTSTGTEDTDFLLVDEILTGASSDYITPAEIVANSNVWDDKDSTDNELTDADDLGEAIVSTNYIEPPSALSGLIGLPNGCVAAYRTGREVYISETFLHYAFPDDYIKRTHYDIKSIGHYGTTIVVGTEGVPYKITGYDPQSMSIEALPDKQSCLFTRAMVSGPTFVLYPSPDGLYHIGEGGNYLTTEKIFTKEQWKTLLTTSTDYDKTIIAFLYDGKYYAFFQGSNTGFIIDFKSDTQFYATFTLTSTWAVYGGYVDIITDTLYLLVYITDAYYIKEWEGDTSNLVYTWKSKVFPEANTFYSCMKINGSFSSDSTGTGTITATSTAVVGVGTAFTTELKPGYPIYNADNLQYREVSSITDNTHLTLVSAFTANFSAKAFKYNSALVNIYRDSSLVFTRAINTTSPFRLPSGYGREYELEFKGTKQIYDVKMGQSMSEL